MQTKTEIGRPECYVPRMLLGRLALSSDELVKTLEGTIVFADVSGFTRLSERLARKGKEGAEHLVDAINTCFSALLGEAYERGGSLLKFGGDAMLLWFAGEEHAARACASAVSMRRTLRDVGRIRAGGTDVVLRMSVGVHTGTYHMFLVGGSHRELVVGGPGTGTVVAMEALASAGQVLLSPDTASQLPGSCLGAAVDSGVLLARAPSAPPWTPPEELAHPLGEVIAECLPTTVRAHLLAGPVAPEHRTAAIAFLQFRGLDRLIAGEGIDRAAARVDELVRIVQDAAGRYEVCFLDSDISADGAKIRLSAGAPRVVGDDEERLLLALRQIIEADLPLPVQAGVNRGPVFTGEVGPAYRRWYAVMGDTVNLAARVMTKAPPGHIYATRDVLRDLKTGFEQTPLEPFAVKGKSRPVHASDVGPPLRGATEAAIRPQLPLVDRRAELEQLRSAVAGARHGSGSLVELVGETGSGKSRLVAEAEKLADGMAVLGATCEVYTRDTPYSTWRDLLRQLLKVDLDAPQPVVLARLQEEVERNHPDLLPWLSLIAIALDVEVAPSIEVEQLAAEARVAKLHEVVLRFVQGALVVPTLVAVEQVQLMDAASAALFGALAREVATSAWVVLVTRRDTPGVMALDDHPHPRIELGPLSSEDAQALALATPEAAQLPPHVVDLAVERSGGSPQFLLDLLAAASGGNRDDLPESIGAATMARIDALDRRDGVIVRRAAVLGPSFHSRRLDDVLAHDMPAPDGRFWKRLSEVFVREPGGLVRFRRPALQEAAYASLPFKLRRELHEAVGLRLEREPDPDPAVLSYHFALSGDHPRAHRYAMAAAKRATERFSHADAARLYRRAIEAGRADGGAADAQSLAQAWEQLGEALRNVGEPVAAAKALTQARRLLRQDPIAQARLCHGHADIAGNSGATTSAVRWLKRGFRYVEAVEGVEAVAWRARLRALLGGIRNRQGRWADAILACRQAISEAESVGELRALARACYVLDWALVESGHPEEASHSRRALEIYEQLGDPEHEFIVLNNLGGFAYLDGRWDDAVELYGQAASCAERAGRPLDVAMLDGNVGEILCDQGHLDEAEEHVQRARRVFSATGDQPWIAFANALLARLAVRRGDRDGARLLEAAMSELRRLKMDAYADLAQAWIVEAEVFGGNALRAIDLASQQLQVNDSQRPLLTRMTGVALALLGQKQAAMRELRHSLAIARERRAEYDIAATIDAMEAVAENQPELRRERDGIVARLKIKQLPRPRAVKALR